MITPETLQKMKADALTSINAYAHLNGVSAENEDYRTLNNYIRISKNLRELDLSTTVAFKYVAESLKENRSIRKLDVSGCIHLRNCASFIEILRVNKSISELNISECYRFHKEQIAALAKALGERAALTHVTATDINYDDGTKKYDPSPVIAALTKSCNIISFTPDKGVGITALRKRIAANRAIAEDIVDKYLNGTPFNSIDMASLTSRLPSVLAIAEEKINDESRIAQMLVDFQDMADAARVTLELPVFYAEPMSGLSRPFTPTANKVDFTQPSLSCAEVFNAAAAGQTDELLSFLQKQPGHFTAEAFLFKPEGARENTIQLIARQGALADFMTTANWAGNPRAFKAVAAAVPEREWGRQMGNVMAGQLLTVINRASFKKAHQPGYPP